MRVDVSKKDYIVVRTAKESGGFNKAQLLRVKSISSNGSFIGILQKDPHLQTVMVEAKPSEVLVNLGPTPVPGKVYGINVKNLYVGSQDHDRFGEVHFFTKPEDDALEKLFTGMSRAAKVLKSHGYDKFIDVCAFVLEVHPKNGKYAGYYKHVPNQDKGPCRLALSAEENTLKNASVGNYTYVVLHELMHAVHFQLLDPKPEINAKWIAMFRHSIAANFVKSEECQNILSGIIKSGTVKDFLATSDEDTRNQVKLIFKWIRQFKNISPKEIQVLQRSSSKEALQTLKDVWPQTNIRAKKLKPLVTEYACKNFRELFAEACTLHLLGKQLPDKVVSLVEESLGLAKNATPMFETVP